MNSLSYDACNICPRSCGVDRYKGAYGICKADSRMMVSRIAPHIWEEPPLVCGKGSGAIFFTHCSLRCIYCQNFDIAHVGLGRVISIQDLAQSMLLLQSQKVSNINLVTPTHYVLDIK